MASPHAGYALRKFSSFHVIESVLFSKIRVDHSSILAVLLRKDLPLLIPPSQMSRQKEIRRRCTDVR